jgi:hypothetical protein
MYAAAEGLETRRPLVQMTIQTFDRVGRRRHLRVKPF